MLEEPPAKRWMDWYVLVMVSIIALCVGVFIGEVSSESRSGQVYAGERCE